MGAWDIVFMWQDITQEWIAVAAVLIRHKAEKRDEPIEGGVNADESEMVSVTTGSALSRKWP